MVFINHHKLRNKIVFVDYLKTSKHGLCQNGSTVMFLSLLLNEHLHISLTPPPPPPPP